jgi:hypothetical protein
MTTPPSWQQPEPTGWAPPAPEHGWVPAGYGQPGGWAPAGYGQPGGYPPPPWALRRPTNTLAIVSLVLAFVCAPAGLVLGVVARRQIRRTGEEGAGLALAGIIVGSLWTGLIAALVVVWLVAVSMLASGTF